MRSNKSTLRPEFFLTFWDIVLGSLISRISVYLFTAKEKQKDMMKDVLANVDSDGSTLLHLAVDSGSTEVSILPRKIFD